MRQNFDRIAPLYPFLERLVFGKELDRARRTFLPPLPFGSRCLLVGEGNGRFLREMLDRSTGAIEVLEASKSMLADLRRRLRRSGKSEAGLSIRHLDLVDWDPPVAGFDCIMTHFFFDLFTPAAQQRLVAKIARAAKDDAIWINVDFVAQPRRWNQRVVLFLAYRFFRAVAGVEAGRLFDPAAYFEKNGCVLVQTRPYWNGGVIAQLWRKKKSGRS